MDLNDLNGKLFAVVLTDENEQSETFFGVAQWDGTALSLDRGSNHPRFAIREEWFDRIQPVNSPVVRAVLNNAEYWIRLQPGVSRAERKSTTAKDTV